MKRRFVNVILQEYSDEIAKKKNQNFIHVCYIIFADYDNWVTVEKIQCELCA